MKNAIALKGEIKLSNLKTKDFSIGAKKLLFFQKYGKSYWGNWVLCTRLQCTIGKGLSRHHYDRIHLASFFIMEKIKQRENGNILK
jgi:hypothetical protein